jgi:hypothetical protein
MHWELLLNEAAHKLDGGARSFPLAGSVTLYEAPNENYERMFFRHIRSSQSSSADSYSSAGWILPDKDSLCQPVFVAHSLLSAIWLVRTTLPDNTVSSDVWACLAHAAAKLSSSGSNSPPPSAQKSVPSSGCKRTTLSTASPISKRPRTSTATSLVSDAATVYGSDIDPRSDVEPAQAPLAHYANHTNHTMRAERKREGRLEATRLKQRASLGLIAPGPGAPLLEQSAYKSIELKDETLLAWVIAQPISADTKLYDSAKLPYHLACNLVGKARALGNPSSRVHAAQFLHAWRERGSPFRSQSTSLHASQAHHPSQVVTGRSSNATDAAFCFAWEICNRSETEIAAVYIENHWAAALLGQAYESKVQQLREDDRATSSTATRSRNGRGKATAEAADELLALVYVDPTAKDKTMFKRRIQKGTRWYTISQTLGWGILCLMPHDVVTNHWVERVLLVAELRIWLDVIQKVNADVVEASHALDSWLGATAIAGGSIGEKAPLAIETEPALALYDIEEIQDSEDCGDSGDSGDDGPGVQASQSQASSEGRTRPPQLRQATLLELFHPVK